MVKVKVMDGDDEMVATAVVTVEMTTQIDSISLSLFSEQSIARADVSIEMMGGDDDGRSGDGANEISYLVLVELSSSYLDTAISFSRDKRTTRGHDSRQQCSASGIQATQSTSVGKGGVAEFGGGGGVEVVVDAEVVVERWGSMELAVVMTAVEVVDVEVEVVGGWWLLRVGEVESGSVAGSYRR